MLPGPGMSDKNVFVDKGKIALIGDAGYASAFPTGMGSSLAMQGATVLADALAESENHEIAFVLPDTEEKINERNMSDRSEK